MESSPRKYLNPQTLAKLKGLRLRARHIVEGYVSGLHRSPYHGFSIEFAEHRDYTPGDDLRYVDWKVFGRTDKVYLKQFEDETNLICYIVLDVSESMLYRGPDAALSKFEYAQCVAASLAWLVLQQQDAVSLTTFDNEIRSFVKPSTNVSQLKQILHVLDQPPSAAKTSTGPIFHELAERFRKRGVVVILSDLFDDVESSMAGLQHFRYRQHDLILAHVLDPAETSFPFQQLTLFKGLERLPQLLADPWALRSAYLREFAAFRNAVQSACRQYQMDYLPLTTDQPLDVALSHYLESRRSRTK